MASQVCLYYGIITTDILHLVLEWLELFDIARLDIAISDKYMRNIYLKYLNYRGIIFTGNFTRSFNNNFLAWLNIRNIKIKNLKLHQDCFINPNAKFYKTLENLVINDINLTDEQLIAILKCCPNLNSINLQDCENLTEISLFLLSILCPKLTKINLNNCWLISDKVINSFAKNYTNLLELDIGDCIFITDESLIKLLYNCKNLKSINLTNNNYIDDNFILKLMKFDYKLKYINITGCNISDLVIFKLLNDSPKFNSISITNSSTDYLYEFSRIEI